MSCCIELTRVIQTSFSPEPEVIVLDSVTDAKGWMKDQTPLLHDHLKAHQFKFVRNANTGHCRMFFKEWSTDDFWLPHTGLAILPNNSAIPAEKPRIIKPYFDPENLKKLESTLRKVSAYLDRAGAADWWKSWIVDAKNYTNPLEPVTMEGL